MNNIKTNYGVIYKITLKTDSRVYIGQTILKLKKRITVSGARKPLALAWG